MIIDSLTSTSMFIEKQEAIKITINKNKNNSGVIYKDDNGNDLVSIYDSGDTLLGRMSEYNGDNNVLFYNEIDNSIKLCKKGDYIDMSIDFIKGTKYYINAKRAIAKSNNDHNFICDDILNRSIFKVYSDMGVEIKNYSISGNEIHIIGSDIMYLDEFSELIVYVYESKNIKDSKEIVIEYRNYHNIFNEQVMNMSYFQRVGFKGFESNCFDKANITQAVTKDTRKESFNTSFDSIINSIDNTIDIDFFLGNEEIDIVQYIGAEEFRIVFVNPFFGRAVVVNNCKIDNGITLSFEKEKNKKIFTISCGNYIDINSSTHSLYGKDEYGIGTYSTKYYIYNSSRVSRR